MRYPARVLWIWVWIGLAAYFALALWLGFIGLVYPYQLDYGEGIVLWFARELARGHSIYGLPGFPYASSNYPPVAMLLSTALAPVLGDGYAPGRLLNLASALVVAGLVFRLVRRETRRAPAALAAALFFLASPYVYHWIPLFRTDLIGLAFAFGGIYCVHLWEGRQNSLVHRSSRAGQRGLLMAAFVLFLLALYTKHTLFAAPAAAVLAMWGRSRRAAVRFALALAAVGGGLFLAIDALTGGGFVYGLITSNATVFLPGQLGELVWSFATTFPIVLLLAAVAWMSRIRSGRLGAIEWYGVTALASLVMAGRVGAWENYFLEFLGVSCVLLGIELSEWAAAPRGELTPRYRLLSVIVPALALIQLVLFWPSHDPSIALNLVTQDLPANQQLAALLRQTPGPVISEDMGALVTSGKDVVYYTFQYSSLARSGQWDQSWELKGLQAGVFPLVILESGTREDVDHYRRFTRDFLSGLDHYYALAETIGKYEVYRPSPLQTVQSADFGDNIGLVGWSLTAADRASDVLQLQIVWQAERAMGRRYTAFVHLESADGTKIAQQDREPHDGAYPTTSWAPGEMVRETYDLRMSSGLAPGPYLLRVGWYDAETRDRLTVPGSADDSVRLTTLGTLR